VIVTSQTPVPVPLPHEPGQVISIRRLTYREVDAAKRAWAEACLAKMDAMSDAARKAIGDAAQALAGREAAGREPDPQPVNPLLNCDKTHALRAGICAWSYPEECTDANKDALDVQSAAVVWAALLELHDPLRSGAASTAV